MSLRRIKDYKKRADFVAEETAADLDQIKKAGGLLKGEQVHCENLIGATLLPMGVAGPLPLKELDSGRCWSAYIPLATTEGALVASVNRGCKAISQAGGAEVLVKRVGVTRAPVFEIKDLAEAEKLRNYLKRNLEKLKKLAASTSAHLRLLRYDFFLHPPFCYLRFYFDSDQAMGMNMATIATQKLIDFIQKNTGVECVAVSGNFCVDKKPSFLNFLLGRGFRVWATAEIPRQICRKVLKTDPERIYRVYLGKNLAGSAFSGSMGFNAHFANIAAAFFAATGQDLAHTVEASLGESSVQIRERTLFFSVHLPAVMMGMVGGGTKLKIKKQAIKITKAESSEELSAVFAAAVLAGEISLLSSLAQGSLATAHSKLGR